ncbi:MAG: sugar phosphate isomerase/epimerase [Spirochaetales bacterium]|nr:sugar phosphate isomerase/epimerase [Spirochaetales bacterium]
MIKTGIYYAYWTSDWNADFIPYIKKVKKLGFDVLEVNAGTISSMTPQKQTDFRNAALDEEIELSCCIGLPSSSDIASDDKNIRRAGIKHLGSIAEAMDCCGIKKLSGIIYSSWPGKLEGRKITKDKARDLSIESMKEAVKKAEDLGLIYNVEVVNRFEQFILNTAAEACAYIDDVGSPNLKILLDTFHMNIEEESMSDAILTAGEKLGHFHLGENNRKPPGLGKLPWNEIFSTLNMIDYDGWVVMEPFLRPGGEVGRDISVYRDIMPGADLDKEAERSCSFINRTIKKAYSV